MKKEILTLISSIYLFLVPFAALAGNVPDTDISRPCDSLCREPLFLYFRFNKALVDESFADNSHTLSAFHNLFSDSVSSSYIDTIFVTAYASPDGNTAYNNRLAHLRAEAVKEYLIGRFPHLGSHCIYACSQGEDWSGLRRLVGEDMNVPDRTEVLEILDNVKDYSRSKALLKQLNCGYAYRYISRNMLHKLRNAAVCTLRIKSIGEVTVAEKMKDKRMDIIKEKGAALCTRANDYLPLQANHSLQSYLQPYFAQSSRPSIRPLFALKTNLLFDLALIPNLELELPLGKRNRWSLNAEWMFLWWLLDNDKYCLQILSGGLEARYWLGNRTTHRILAGHFLGFYAGGGKYDLQWKEDGYQGEFYIASGISYGYSTPIARRLNLEFSIGIGLLRTSYEHYHAINNYRTLLWQNDGNYSWLGPTKAKISLVWLLGQKRKGGEK